MIRAIQRKPIPRTPVWIMRQAGRYLPEYRATRQKAGSFMDLCQNPELACEVTLQPLRRFELDAAILFSDILTIPDAMGLGLYFEEGEGPKFKKSIRTIKDIEQLGLPDVNDDLKYVMDAVSLIRHEMPKQLPLFGFSGSPWTLASYMVEGQSSRDFKHILHMMYDNPQSMHMLLHKIAAATKDYLKAQIDAGINIAMIFDTWGGILPHAKYIEFSLNYMKPIIQELKAYAPQIPVILFTKGGGQWLSDIVSSGCDGVGLDWTTNLFKARSIIKNRVALQGNLNPFVLKAKPDVIRNEVKAVLESYGHGSGHIFNLGHGITPDVPPEHLEVLVNSVHEYSPAFHKEAYD